MMIRYIKMASLVLLAAVALGGCMKNLSVADTQWLSSNKDEVEYCMQIDKNLLKRAGTMDRFRDAGWSNVVLANWFKHRHKLKSCVRTLNQAEQIEKQVPPDAEHKQLGHKHTVRYGKLGKQVRTVTDLYWDGFYAIYDLLKKGARGEHVHLKDEWGRHYDRVVRGNAMHTYGKAMVKVSGKPVMLTELVGMFLETADRWERTYEYKSGPNAATFCIAWTEALRHDFAVLTTSKFNLGWTVFCKQLKTPGFPKPAFSKSEKRKRERPRRSRPSCL